MHKSQLNDAKKQALNKQNGAIHDRFGDRLFLSIYPKKKQKKMELDFENGLNETKITELVAAFYQRVKTDALLGPMYPQDDFEGAEKRLRDFLIYRFGGPDRYIQERGHPRLGMRHMNFKIGVAERDRWMALMSEAIDEANMPADTKGTMKDFFQHVANFLQNS